MRRQLISRSVAAAAVAVIIGGAGPAFAAAAAAADAQITEIHSTAAGPAVDVRVGGTATITNLTNPNEQAMVTAAGTVSAAEVVPTGTDRVIQVISGADSAPGGAAGGSGGFVDSGGPPGWVWLGVLTGALLTVACGVALLAAPLLVSYALESGR